MHSKILKDGSDFPQRIDFKKLPYEYLVPANGNKLIKTDWKIQYPDGYLEKYVQDQDYR